MIFSRWLVDARRRLTEVDAAASEARHLVELALGWDRSRQLSNRDVVLEAEALATLERFLERRLAGEPTSRIAGVREFWSLGFRLNSATLDPRPDSETLVQAVLDAAGEQARSAPMRLADLGTGTGALALALLHEAPGWSGILVDLSAEAALMAARNASDLGLASRSFVLVGSWTQALADQSIDILISNPPYISEEEMQALDPEVRDHDPELALAGGEDGLDPYRLIAADIRRVVRPGGLVALEIASMRDRPVIDLLQREGLIEIDMVRDPGNLPRVVLGRIPSTEFP